MSTPHRRRGSKAVKKAADDVSVAEPADGAEEIEGGSKFERAVLR